MTPRKTIAIVATGGTIAATTEASTALADYTVTQGVEDLVSAVPGLSELAELETHQACKLDSRNIDSADQLDIATRVKQLLSEEHIDGVVVAHGTDTMEETAVFLHLCLDSTKPIVMVGAMRPASALSADGPMNLYQAVQLAIHSEARHRGVLVVANDRIHLASEVRKLHTTSVGAFYSSSGGPAGVINADGVHFYAPAPSRAALALIDLNALSLPLPKVDIVFDHPDANPAYYDTAIQSGSAGIVIASVGNGSLSPAAHAGARQLHEHAITCIRSSRIPLGATTASELDVLLHTIAGQFWSAQQCRIILMLAIAIGLLNRDEQEALFHAAWEHAR
ncbi:asparaginase [Paenalcaligenes niemegkensis]|uniref:asparaginase n=1 Tax=Paenalcaligenes niemegkensis TaxID=2895469 RepID=UPI001EE852C3|nr:asparaginase [Paenalcaligenes niemegkensis]MCQ9617636.1 asparaginase [Paenalcaligenes niemegkensis]